ncbi:MULTISPECIES: 4-(cytidine 5'-diphospho)-2-C-methyl-D-erythritol kinase [Caproicibacterium]|jgi:4-diphosphocytidyl-2-C-methyl-D-erythritol kinase|uniref:4-diphosphocytidyl-2-C-methyl-D-erythritol kinase n=1 Tax=Caproicibacterium lactatifermentans TaxID=2666138 RepID=A0A859DW28_9FIRM|nr:4-(cytidine 5'-diphospho)-2-C-methyl-D-erythritol kinase [Caproicibacterium lactatifermentans]ARP50018.1 4-(cytidine 5'-diphospho)-2-C-methyl-D-erythritol kinase [Ruminococcaceae bacterium CPB6]MDD4808146.1 4-(cytidine 5'-diphospho)-2-C-methyl-D-erythritol kinase [Oscillospiraceae bacterium]QKN24201.1 4-(cytidine 5'-diphospho)-2-C-methyl-D-erythritol kinase [Caproicibacterium lactatifermentans]QKO30730.1 4-(cytidine 5'-diphospho)-2-C-methyl-D-erythritol kinase [Caproicibacterium lactatiferme
MLQEPAFAKLNLSLDITGRRVDGYHLLSMVNVSISLHDTLSFSRGGEGLQVLCKPDSALSAVPGAPNVPEGKDNLVFRAAEVFFQLSGIQDQDVCIAVQKRIPSQAGLGGGSADAAAALRGLCRLYGCAIPAPRLCRAAESIGADVPFCVQGGTARVEGIGEQLTELPALPPCWFVVCKPAAGISTAMAYRRADEDGLPPQRGTPRVEAALRRGSLAAVGQSLCNAFQTLIPLPETADIRARLLRAGALGACMTGSGSAVFGLFCTKPTAQKALEEVQQKYPCAFLCIPQDKLQF